MELIFEAFCWFIFIASAMFSGMYVYDCLRAGRVGKVGRKEGGK